LPVDRKLTVKSRRAPEAGACAAVKLVLLFGSAMRSLAPEKSCVVSAVQVLPPTVAFVCAFSASMNT